MTKRNKRKKGLFGIDDAIIIPALISTAASIGTSIYNNKQQTDAAQRSIDEQAASLRKASNLQNTAMFQSNLYNLANSQQEEKNRIIPTQTSALRLGGRRCKKCGGGRLTKFI